MIPLAPPLVAVAVAPAVDELRFVLNASVGPTVSVSPTG